MLGTLEEDVWMQCALVYPCHAWCMHEDDKATTLVCNCGQMKYTQCQKCFASEKIYFICNYCLKIVADKSASCYIAKVP